MTQVEMPLHPERLGENTEGYEHLKEALEARSEAARFLEEEKYLEAMERTVTALRIMRDFPDYDNLEFRALLVALLFDLAEIH